MPAKRDLNLCKDTTVVENMVKKNRNGKKTADLFFWFYDCNIEILGAYNIPLDRS